MTEFEDKVELLGEGITLEDLEGGDEGDLNVPFNGKVVLEKADRSLSELHRWHNSGRIILDPEWQRNYVWDRGRASKLIESFLLDIPVRRWPVRLRRRSFPHC